MDKWSVRLIQWLCVVQKNKIILIVETKFDAKNKHTLFVVIAKKSVEVVFEQTIDKIKEVNRMYVME